MISKLKNDFICRRKNLFILSMWKLTLGYESTLSLWHFSSKSSLCEEKYLSHWRKKMWRKASPIPIQITTRGLVHSWVGIWFLENKPSVYICGKGEKKTLNHPFWVFENLFLDGHETRLGVWMSAYYIHITGQMVMQNPILPPHWYGSWCNRSPSPPHPENHHVCIGLGS
jgi:hypothetical protein